MSTIAIEEAVHRLDELIKESEAGHDILLTRQNRPVAKIVALPPPREPGSAKHLPHHMAEDFDAVPDGFEDYMP